MDYGDGKLNGHYQFNSKYRERPMCDTLNRNVGKCDGKFRTSSGGSSGGSSNGGKTPPPPAPRPPPPPPPPPPPSGKRFTTEGCECSKFWGSSKGICRNYCCNFFNDPNGEICVHRGRCSSSGAWYGYC